LIASQSAAWSQKLGFESNFDPSRPLYRFSVPLLLKPRGDTQGPRRDGGAAAHHRARFYSRRARGLRICAGGTTMKRIFIAIALFSLAVWQAFAQVAANHKRGDSDSMNRIDRTNQKYQELFGPQTVANSSDPELMNILQRFIFGEVFYIGNLDDKTRELITITVLTTNETLPQLKAHTNAALNIGVTPIEIREVVYQTAPFIGFPKVLNALDTINEVFASRNIQLPLENKGTVTESERVEKGNEKQYPIYGDAMKQNMKDLPGEFAEVMPRILTELCRRFLHKRWFGHQNEGANDLLCFGSTGRH
jgi:4-carboxymuconolactone decarboxylase